MPVDQPPVQLWHGGTPGLEAGSMLLPPSTTAIKFTRLDRSFQLVVTSPVSQRNDRVYVTSDRELAQVFASNWSGDGVSFGWGWLYLVSVDPAELEPDADLLSLPGVSYQCTKARIERVWQREVKPTPNRDRQLLQELLARHGMAKEQQQLGPTIDSPQLATCEEDHFVSSAGQSGQPDTLHP